MKKKHSDISVLEEGMCGKDAVVRLYNGCGDLWWGIDSETKLQLFAIINREALQKKRSKTRSGTATNSIENQETLKTNAVICKLSDPIQEKINNLFSNCHKLNNTQELST